MASQITSLTIVYLIDYSGADQRKHQSLRVTDLCGDNSPVTGECPAQMASNAENVSIWWRHHDIDGFVQDCSNSSANSLELLQSCTKPSSHGSHDVSNHWLFL